jgi:thymidine kinase
MSKITLIIGPMYSGKTTEAIRLVDRERIAGKKCIIIKYSLDTRYDDKYVTTHAMQMYNKCDILHRETIDKDFIKDLITKKEYQVVCIEEGQFFKDIDYYACMLANSNIRVIISALDGTYKQTNFGDIHKLIPHAEEVIKLNAICMDCKNDTGSFTLRTSSDDKEIIIGGTEMYICVCRSCKNKRHPPIY